MGVVVVPNALAAAERLKIHVGEMALDHAFIHTPIESGRLVLRWAYHHRLQNLPNSPCGSQP